MRLEPCQPPGHCRPLVRRCLLQSGPLRLRMAFGFGAKRLLALYLLRQTFPGGARKRPRLPLPHRKGRPSGTIPRSPAARPAPAANRQSAAAGAVPPWRQIPGGVLSGVENRPIRTPRRPEGTRRAASLQEARRPTRAAGKLLPTRREGRPRQPRAPPVRNRARQEPGWIPSRKRPHARRSGIRHP